jgi:Ca2+-binding RTX toxin-like protein
MVMSHVAIALLTTCIAYLSPIHGTPGDDRLSGTLGDDVIHGYRGDDHLWGRRGADTLDGGRGDDVLRAWVGGQGKPIDPGPDIFRGGPGDDALFVSHGDRVKAGPGDDDVWAYYLDEGTDVIDCGSGQDVLHLHQNLPGLSTPGCEVLDVQIAG